MNTEDTQKENIKVDKYKKLRHDANNQLTVILGFAQLLEMKIDKQSKEQEWITKILKECGELKKSIDQIK